MQIFSTATAQITKRPKDLIVREGGSVRFPCVTAGNPQPTVFWEKEGVKKLMFPNQGHGRFRVKSNGDLTISNVQKADTAKYLCSAVNTAGVGGVASASLTVLGTYRQTSIN